MKDWISFQLAVVQMQAALQEPIPWTWWASFALDALLFLGAAWFLWKLYKRRKRREDTTDSDYDTGADWPV